MLPNDAVLIQTLHNLGHLMKPDEWNIFQPGCKICYLTSLNVVPLLFEIFQRNVQIDFESQQSHDTLLCFKRLTQNGSLGFYQAKMPW